MSRAGEALEALCRTYWYPLYAYIRRRGYAAPEAQDLTQEFLARLLGSNGLATVDRRKGRFRSFLLASLNHFLANEWDRARAAKRGGTAEVLSLNDAAVEARYALEPAPDLTPEKLYDRQWALALLDRALQRLQSEFVAAGKGPQFECLKEFLHREGSDRSYEEVGRELGIKAPAVASAVYRLRQRYEGKRPEPCALLDSPSAAARLMAAVARAVHHAHQRGILHRDLKPGNILVDRGGKPWVTDFGLAKYLDQRAELTQANRFMGTPYYVSPEQAQGERGLTAATDIYSLGAVLYHLLTGHPVAQANTAWETLRAVVEQQPLWPGAVSPRVDRDLGTVCMKCLEKDPQRRYASADALAEDLDRG